MTEIISKPDAIGLEGDLLFWAGVHDRAVSNAVASERICEEEMFAGCERMYRCDAFWSAVEIARRDAMTPTGQRVRERALRYIAEWRDNFAEHRSYFTKFVEA